MFLVSVGKRGHKHQNSIPIESDTIYLIQISPMGYKVKTKSHTCEILFVIRNMKFVYYEATSII